MQACSSPPLKRSRESIHLLPDGASKCAEIFVTDNADKWTLFCAYCDKATNDIGVFICHIRLEHLNIPAATAQNVQIADKKNVNQKDTEHFDRELIFTQIPIAVLSEETEVQPQQQPSATEIIKEELIIDSGQEDLSRIISHNENVNEVALLNQAGNKQMDDPNVNKDPNYKLYKDSIGITAVDHQADQQDSEGIKQLIYKNVYGSNDKDIDNPDCRKTKGRNIKSKESSVFPLKCNICNKNFYSKLGLKLHLKSKHKRVKFNVYTAELGLQVRSKSKHKKYKRYKCSVCSTEHFATQFISHVLTHESDSCFPCEVCGKVYLNNNERRKHWKSHVDEKPFYCKFCYRRYPTKILLKYHLVNHKRYRCNFCSNDFISPKPQNDIYICEKCDQMSSNGPELAQTKA